MLNKKSVFCEVGQRSTSVLFLEKLYPSSIVLVFQVVFKPKSLICKGIVSFHCHFIFFLSILLMCFVTMTHCCFFFFFFST